MDAVKREIFYSSIESMIEKDVVLFKDKQLPDRTYGEVTINEVKEVMPLESKRFQRYVIQMTREKVGRRCGTGDARFVIGQVVAKAHFKAPAYQLAVRVGEDPPHAVAVPDSVPR